MLSPRHTGITDAEQLQTQQDSQQIFTSYIGQGRYETITPAPIQHNVLENAAWNNPSMTLGENPQGRLEVLFNFQITVSDFTALPVSCCSLLDEASTVVESVAMMLNLRSDEQVARNANVLFVDQYVFSQTLATLQTRTPELGIEIEVGDYADYDFDERCFGALVQYPNALGQVEEYADFVTEAHEHGVKVTVIADILSLALLKAPGKWDVDICIGSAQRWGIPMVNGAATVAYFSTREAYKCAVPECMISISRDVNGVFKQENTKADICTSQALWLIMAGLYTVYHGANGVRDIAERVHSIASYINEMLGVYGYMQENDSFFDTLKITLPDYVSADDIRQASEEYDVNFYYFADGALGLSINETIDVDDVNVLIDIFASVAGNSPVFIDDVEEVLGLCTLAETQMRSVDYLQHEVFCNYRTEKEMLDYIKYLTSIG